MSKVLMTQSPLEGWTTQEVTPLWPQSAKRFAKSKQRDEFYAVIYAARVQHVFTGDVGL